MLGPKELMHKPNANTAPNNSVSQRGAGGKLQGD